MSKIHDFSQELRRNFASIGVDSSLHVWLQEEKDVIKELRNLAKEQGHADKYMGQWGKAEADDIKNITEKLAYVGERFAEATLVFADKYEKSRAYIKEVKASEDSLSSLYKRQKDLRSKLDSAQKKKNKDVEPIRKDLAEMDQVVLSREATHEGFKRERLKAAMNARWDGLMEYSIKLSIVANFGNHLTNQIPQGDPVPGRELPPFAGASVTSQIMADYEKCWGNWIASSHFPFKPAALPPLGLQAQSFNSAADASVKRSSWSTISRSNPDIGGSSTPSVGAADDVTPTGSMGSSSGAAIAAAISVTDTSTPSSPSLARPAQSTTNAVPYDAQPYVAQQPTVATPSSESQPRVSQTSTSLPYDAPLYRQQQQQPYEAHPYKPQQPYDAQPYSALPATTSSPYGAPIYNGPAIPSFPHIPSAPAAPASSFAAPFEAQPVSSHGGYATPLDPTLAPTSIIAAAIQPNQPMSIVPPSMPGGLGLDIGGGGPSPGGVAGKGGGAGGGGAPVSPTDSASMVKMKEQGRSKPPPPPPTYEAAANAVRKMVGGLGVFVVCFDWVPTQSDELAFVVGDAIAASEVYEDGWAYGRVLRTSAIGFFPFNAVVPAINGFGEPARSPPGQPTPESLRDEGSITPEAYRIVTEAIAALRGPGPERPMNQMQAAVAAAAGLGTFGMMASSSSSSSEALVVPSSVSNTDTGTDDVTPTGGPTGRGPTGFSGDYVQS
ncbi:hypothetical protein HK101_008186 [Irineochytrium annulatum]|nr:hypothetical protein HK101_008186 [Irineochytrium annulatum]